MPFRRPAPPSNPPRPLWHGEDGPRHGSATTGDHRVRMQQVVLHNACILVGDMLELFSRGHVAQHEDAVRSGPLVLVDDDQPSVVGADRSRRVPSRECRRSTSVPLQPTRRRQLAASSSPLGPRGAPVRVRRGVLSTSLTLVLTRTSTRRPRRSVNRSAISTSSRRSSTSDLLTTVTAVPNAENT